jgi:hypothetical protein
VVDQFEFSLPDLCRHTGIIMPRLPVGKRHEPAIATSDMMGVGFSALGCMTPFSGTRNGTKQGEGRCRGKLPIMRLNGLAKCSATSVGTSGWQCQRRREGRHLAERELRQVIFDKAYRPGGEHESFWAPPPFQDAHQHAPFNIKSSFVCRKLGGSCWSRRWMRLLRRITLAMSAAPSSPANTAVSLEPRHFGM